MVRSLAPTWLQADSADQRPQVDEPAGVDRRRAQHPRVRAAARADRSRRSHVPRPRHRRTIKHANEHHAGELEISQVFYKFPHTIRPEKFSHAACDFDRLLVPFGNRISSAPDADTIDQP